MVFVRSVSNSGGKAGGTICGFWRASLPLIIFPGVALEEGTAHCCIITSCRLGFPIMECVLWGDNRMLGPRKTIVVYSSQTIEWRGWLLGPCLVRSLTSFGHRVPHHGGRTFVSSPHPTCQGAVRSWAQVENGHFLSTNRKSMAQNNGKKWNHHQPSKALVIWANCYEGQWELLKGLKYIKSRSTIGRDFDINRALDRALKSHILIQALPLAYWVTLSGIFFLLCPNSLTYKKWKFWICFLWGHVHAPCSTIQNICEVPPWAGSTPGLQVRDGEGVQQSSRHHQVWGKDLSLPPVQAETVMH